MIDEEFLKRAVIIRRSYLNLNKNMNFYQDKIKNVYDKLQKTIENITEIQKKISDGITKNPQDAVEKMISILTEIESEGEYLEKLITPLNKKIEKLANEEKELYRLIKERHHDVHEDKIVNIVKERLIKENLQ
jgi:predicted  nucleic acid-binding Zn-ribbon protein